MANEAPSVSIVRATVATAVAMGILFAGCWAGVAAKIVASHMFVQLFTAQPISTTAALANGLLSSVVFGALLGFLVSGAYKIIPLGRG
jgi:hypothetical protein